MLASGSSGLIFIFENTSYSFHFSTFVLNLLRFGSFAANCRLGCKEVLNRQQNAAFLKGAHQPYSSLIILRHLQSILRQEYCFILKKCKNFEKSRNSIRIFTQKFKQKCGQMKNTLEIQDFKEVGKSVAKKLGFKLTN